MEQSFCRETDGMHASYRTQQTACESYKKFLTGMEYVSADNLEMSLMSQSSVATHLATNRAAMKRFAEA